MQADICLHARRSGGRIGGRLRAAELGGGCGEWSVDDAFANYQIYYKMLSRKLSGK